MIMIVIFSGLPGSGKSYKLAQTVVSLLYRNRKFYAKQMARYKAHPEQFVLVPGEEPTPPRLRVVWSNLKLTERVESEFAGAFQYWSNLSQLTPLRDVDVIFDEVSVYFDSRLWSELSLDMRRWVNQHRKFGIEIYGNAQDFAQVDKAFRRVTSDLLYLTKLMGSRDPSPTMPPPKYIWGLVAVRHLDPVAYDEEKSKFAAKGIPSPMFITRRGTEIFDTRAEIRMSSALPARHVERICELGHCTFHKIIHV